MKEWFSPSSRIEDQSKKFDKLKGVGKFVVGKDGTIYSGPDTYGRSHESLAGTYGLSDDDIVGGGIIDFTKKSVFGRSGKYGRFSADMMRKALPRWTIEGAEDTL